MFKPKAIVSLCVISIFLSSATAQALPEGLFTLIPAITLPAADPDDATVTETTIGAERKALAYFNDDTDIRTLVNNTIIPSANRVVQAYNLELKKKKPLSLMNKLLIGAGVILSLAFGGAVGYIVGINK
jgi:hypothetical protein